MIDPNTETLLSLADAAKSLPVRRAGKRPHLSCLYRWSTVGCRGVILETIQIGGTRCTSKQALARFFRRLTGATGPIVCRPETLPQHSRRRRREVAAAIGELEREGL